MQRLSTATRLALVCLALANPPLRAAEAPATPVQADFSRAPEAAARANAAQALVAAWYPRINALLFAPGHALPHAQLRLVFQPNLPHAGAAAYARGDTIYVSSEYIKVQQDSFEGMMVHELAHINQHYPRTTADTSWAVEGIADYVRHKYFEQDITATLTLDAHARLQGYTPAAPYFLQLQQNGTPLEERGYLQSYTVASTFLYWLEQRKNKDIVVLLNLALSEGRYQPTLFTLWAGAPLDALWKEFVAEGKKAGTP